MSIIHPFVSMLPQKKLPKSKNLLLKQHGTLMTKRILGHHLLALRVLKEVRGPWEGIAPNSFKLKDIASGSCWVCFSDDKTELTLLKDSKYLMLEEYLMICLSVLLVLMYEFLRMTNLNLNAS